MDQAGILRKFIQGVKAMSEGDEERGEDNFGSDFMVGPQFTRAHPASFTFTPTSAKPPTSPPPPSYPTPGPPRCPLPPFLGFTRRPSVVRQTTDTPPAPNGGDTFTSSSPGGGLNAALKHSHCGLLVAVMSSVTLTEQ